MFGKTNVFEYAIKAVDKFSQTHDKLNREIQESGSLLDAFGKTVLTTGALLGAGYLADRTLDAVIELGKLGAQSIDTRQSFESLTRSAGVSTGILRELQNAAGGTITELRLMQITNSALAGTSGELSKELGQALPKLLEYARASSKASGGVKTVDYALQSMVTGIRRGTPLLIDNADIVLKLGEVNEKYAKSIGKTVDQLTSEERSLAVLFATMEGGSVLYDQVGGNLDTMTDQIMSADVAVQELKTALGELFAPAIAAGARETANEIRSLTAALRGDDVTKWSIALADAEDRLERLKSGPLGGVTVLVREQEKEVERLREELVQAEAAAASAAPAIASVGAGAEVAAAGLANATFAADQFANRFKSVFDTIKQANQSRDFAIGRLVNIEGLSETELRGRLKAYEDGLARVRLLKEQNKIDDVQLAMAERDLNDALIKNLDVLGPSEDAWNDYRRSLEKTGATADDTATKIKGLIKSELTPSFDLFGLSGGMMGEDPEAYIDTHYRRLLAVALRGQEELARHQQDWADTFAAAGIIGLNPEEAQARAAELVKNYYEGTDASLIDKELVKNRIRRQLALDQMFAELADEIYAEMSGRDVVNTKGMLQGTISAWGVSTENMTAELKAAGAATGSKLLTGIKGAVIAGAGDIIGELAQAIAPSVAAELARNSRYGAPRQ